ncbi:uncharacterized protein PpBr36_10858 [Pyricularia pennisetigena]|uniref:uncharacterized protein n=1 Tax=Pyricularia pennisetigena TaxID=1578925 RepID=UPI00114E7298|nr:uncharacterized protein PpBr36_10858 [Pyricularia pennisetigena]TLS20852.1 hypothetical protein PpBr36_10858 [Pyricularia pennisetigena]
MLAVEVVDDSRLDHLPARPPTPPQRKGSECDAQLRLAPETVVALRNLHTPPNANTPSALGSSRRKKVEFSAQTEYREPLEYQGNENVRRQRTPASIPHLSAPVKSILKVTSSPAPNPLDPANGCSPGGINLPSMLESSLAELAGNDRDAKVDAYTMIVRALKISNNLPDRIALQDKMPLFMQFIQRDISTNNGDVSLVNHAYRLLTTFLHFPAIASTIENESAVFVIDHCIKILTDASLSKEMAKNVLLILSAQSFSLKVMTSDRVGKVVTALHSIPDSIMDNKNAFIGRMSAYRNLVKRYKASMVQHSEWLLDFFMAMVTTKKEVLPEIIRYVEDITFMLCTEKHFVRKVLAFLQQPFPTQDSSSFVEWFEGKLQEMLLNQETCRFVPVTWSVVTLLLPNIGEWDLFTKWMRLIMACFNHKLIHVQIEANRAFPRLAYAFLNGNPSVGKKHLSLLCSPYNAAQKRAAGVGKEFDELAEAIINGIYALLFLIFKPPSAPVKQGDLERYWDQALTPVMRRLMEKKMNGRDTSAHVIVILTGLFDCSIQRVWNPERIFDRSPISPTELLAIDPKWLRRNSGRVFTVLEPILRKSYQELSNTRSATHALWRALLGAVATAGSKEIKVSAETAGFLGHAIGLLGRIWADGVPMLQCQSGGSVQFLASTREYILVMTDKLGRLPFTEKVLAMDQDRTFVPSTPSQRFGKHQKSSRATIHHMFLILVHLPPGVLDNDDLVDFFRTVFTPLLNARDAQARKSAAQELIQLIPADALCPAAPWSFVAELIAAGMESASIHSTPSSLGNDVLLGQEYREVVKILERGLRRTQNLPWPRWQSLYDSLHKQVRQAAGDAGVAIILIEPLAKILLDELPEDGSLPLRSVGGFIDLISSATQPRDRQALDVARRNLWGTSATGSRSVLYAPFENLYSLANSVLVRLYSLKEDSEDAENATVTCLNEVEKFLGRCTRQLELQTLSTLQLGLVPWIRDENTRLNSRLSIPAVEVAKSLWDRVLVLISTIDTHEKLPLAALEDLLCAAFESKHRHIVNSVSTLWNKMVENAENISYPDKLKAVLVSRHHFIDINLPGIDLSQSTASAAHAQGLDMIDTQEDMNMLNTDSTKSISLVKKGLTPVKTSVSRRQSPRKTPSASSGIRKSSVNKRRKAKASPRLRHDDSQVDFAPIDSSPSAVTFDSQVLTERQKEVRARQKAAAAMLPEIVDDEVQNINNSVSGPSLQPVPQPSSPANRDLPRASTPEKTGIFDDYVSSTPTPRRGQLLHIIDIDNTDPPSSPPEPRRYPLIPELNVRGSNSGLVDDWQLSSSPPSGTPEPEPDISEGPAAMLVHYDVDSEMIIDETEYDLGRSEEVLEPVDEKRDSVNKSTPSRQQRSANRHTRQSTRLSLPATPRRSRRFNKSAQGSPKLDDDVSVDALISPKAVLSPTDPTPTDDTSFEQSMLRLVVELDSQDRPVTNFVEPTPSPEKNTTVQSSCAAVQDAHDEIQQHSNSSTAQLECITVGRKHLRRGRGRPPKSKEGSASQSTEPSEILEPNLEDTPDLSPSKQKRKRQSSSVAEDSANISPKKPKHRQASESQHEIPDSQATGQLAVPGATSQARTRGATARGKHAYQTVAAAECSQQEVEEGLDVIPDGGVVADTESQIQSQIALEEAESRKAERIITHEEAHGAMVIEISNQVSAAGVALAEVSEEQSKSNKSAKSPFATILAMLKGGLGALRGAELSRSEVSELEDICMDFKRELYAAEKRGRA